MSPPDILSPSVSSENFTREEVQAANTKAGEVNFEPVAWSYHGDIGIASHISFDFVSNGADDIRPLYSASTVEALKAENERLLNRLDVGPHGEDAVDVLESSAQHLRAENAALLSRVERLRAALAFYADPANWKDGGFTMEQPTVLSHVPCSIDNDQGQIARAALQEKSHD